MFYKSTIELQKQSPEKNRCAKADRCLYGDECPNEYKPINDYYGCFDAGNYDKIIDNIPRHIYEAVERDILRRRRYGKERRK